MGLSSCFTNFSCFGSSKPIKTPNTSVTMESNNIVPFQIPVGHLEPFETRSIYSLPPLPELKNKKVLRGILRIQKKKGWKEFTGIILSNDIDQADVHGSDQALEKEKEKSSKSRSTVTEGYARTGETVIREVIEELLSMKGEGLEAEQTDKIKNSFTSDNQAHYLAICYRMEQHVHHYGNWGTMTTKDLADVFRGYVGALTAESEMGMKGLWRWLHRLLDDIVLEEISYAAWLTQNKRMAQEAAKPGASKGTEK